MVETSSRHHNHVIRRTRSGRCRITGKIAHYEQSRNEDYV